MDEGVKGHGIRYGRGEGGVDDRRWGRIYGGEWGVARLPRGGQPKVSARVKIRRGHVRRGAERVRVRGRGCGWAREQEMRTFESARKVYVRPSVKTCLG